MASKNLERIYLRHFLTTNPQFVIEDESDSREAPDFMLRDDEGLIGLEVTQLFRDSSILGSSARAIESRRLKFLRSIAEKYYPTGSPILVKAAIHDRPTETPQMVADALRSNCPPNSWETATVSFPGDSKYLITALPPEAGQYKIWQCLNNHIGWVGRLDRKLIIDCIQKKAKLLSKYRRSATRVALLLVVDRTFKSGMVNAPAPGEAFNSEGFDKVYLQIYPGRILRLA